MKRLGRYVVIALVLISVTGGFLFPQKSLAAVTQTDVTNIISKVTAVLSSVPGVNQDSFGQKLYIQKFSVIANDKFKEIGSDPTVTPARLEFSTLNAYQAYLQDLRSNASTENINFITADINAIIPLINAAGTATSLEAGTITQQQADQSNADAAAAAAAGRDRLQALNNPANGCTSIITTFQPCISAGITWIIKNTLLELAGFLVWVSANMLNYAIQIGVLGFSQWAPDALYPIWVIVRQIVSLFIVFAGLWLGFMYIIGRDDNFKKYIPWVIVFALFVNFSYPLSRALIDVSNVISLNIYTSAVGSDVLTGNDPNHTAGGLIMDRLGLQGLVSSATGATTSGGMVGAINSTPGALLAVAYVLYAAYIFLMATAIIAMRTAVLVFLVIASPLLFVDSVIPKLGDKAAELRKMYFEQLVVAPVFMIMLALTLKFLEVFQVGMKGTTAAGANSSIATFFNILMMLIMLHIMIKVTKSLSGEAGKFATNAMGKVGGFGLGVATGGAGFLARGTLGTAAARLRDSKTMDGWQGSRTGRGLYSLTNSMANSTYDTRNIGMVSKGMASAGMGMGKGSDKSYDANFKIKDEAIKKKYGSIKDGAAREQYLAQKTGSFGSKAQNGGLGLIGLRGVDARSDAQITVDKIRKAEKESIEKYNNIKDEDKKREYLESLPENVREQIKKQPATTEAKPATTSGPNNSTQNSGPLPSGYTAVAPSGILVPDRPSSVRPKEVAETKPNNVVVPDTNPSVKPQTDPKPNETIVLGSSSSARPKAGYDAQTKSQSFNEYMKGIRKPGTNGETSVSTATKITPPVSKTVAV